ncbi:MAG: flagellar assembly peptidoglycan hydrolase FlgJ [Comamonas sp.]|nr:flagellar assembly peptidoglycan hydrolase FlgJ [Comamonas sp.]
MSNNLNALTGYNAGNQFVGDVNALNALKTEGNSKSPEAAREAAKQLESLFMREMIKSMRSATMKSGLLNEEGGTELARDMYDQQLSVSMSGLPGGLSAAITAQIARAMGVDEQEALQGLQAPIGGLERGAGTFNFAPSTLSFADSRSSRSSRFAQQASRAGLLGTAANAQSLDALAPSPKGRDNFVKSHAAAAQRVARESGIPAHYMLGQAGHETGWGKSEIRGAGGANSFNLFGIKAGGGWKGKVAEITTTEYINGQARKLKAKFRAYDSYEESFRDYARLISQNPRYAQAMQSRSSAHGYAAALQKAGYATDPQYANKLSRAIESAQAVQRASQG